MTSTLKDVLRYVSAEILLKGIGVVSLLYVAKLLNPEEFGYFSMALFVIAISTSLAEFGAASLILRDYHVMGSRCLIRAVPVAVGVSLVVSVFIVIAGKHIAELNRAFLALADHPFMISVMALLNVFSVLVSCFLIVSLRAALVTRATVARSLVVMSSLVVLVTYNRSYESQLQATLTGDAVFLGIFALHFRRRIAEELRYLWSLDLKVVVVRQIRDGFVFLSKEVIGVIQGHMARLILSAFLPVSQLGIYSFFFNIFMSLNLFIASVDRVYTPRMIKLYGTNPARARGLVSSLLPLVVAGAGAVYLGILVGGEGGLYRLAFREEYVANSLILDTLAFLLVTSGLLQMISFSYYIGDWNTSIRDMALASLVCSVSLQVLLIPRYGLRGAVIAEVTASGIRLGIVWFLNRRFLIVQGDSARITVFLLVISFWGAVVVINTMIGLPWGVFLSLMAAVPVLYGIAHHRHLQECFVMLRSGAAAGL